MANRLRSQRRRLFSRYLRTLDQDSRQVFMALRLILLYSSHDRPDLAAALIRREFGFALHMAKCDCGCGCSARICVVWTRPERH